MKTSLTGVLLALAVTAGPAFAQAPGGAGTPFIVQQPAGEWLTSLFIGQLVSNPAGETVGDINDLLFDKTGRVTVAVLGVGGFIGIGDKSVGVPFSSLGFSTGKDGKRVVTVALTKQALQAAPAFNATEKSTYTKLKEKAEDLGHKAVEKAGELKGQAAKKIEDMKKEEPQPK
jgi:high-affinity K+ transport system ATPase subunit B